MSPEKVTVSVVLFFLCLLKISSSDSSPSMKDGAASGSSAGLSILQKIEGKVQVVSKDPEEWMHVTKVCLNGGEYCGFLKSSGEFVIHNVPPGTYLVEVYSPNFDFESVRVDISSKNGKIRAREVNLLKSTAVSHIPYPLKFKAEKQAIFFEKRESWNLISTLKNPMVLLMVAPVLLMLILPRLMKAMDPESQKEMQESMSMMQQPGASLPSIEEFFTNMFGGGTAKTAKKPSNKVAKRRDKH